MDVTPLVREGAQIIQSYKGGKFKISGKIYNGPVMVMPEATTAWDASQGDISVQDFAPLFEQADNIDVVLYGTGAKSEFFPPAIKESLKQKGLNVDAMDTGAACRTYNVLMAEGRRVVAVLIPF